MDVEFNAEQEELRASVRRYLAERAPIAWVRSIADEPAGTTDVVWKGIADLGLTALLVPEEYGGLGASMVDLGVALEEMGRAVHPGPYVSSAVGAVSLVTACAGAGDCERLLPTLADGTAIGAVADRPGVDVGADDRLTGGVRWVADGAAATVVLVVTGNGVYEVDPGDDGVTVEPAETVDFTRRFAHVRLSRVTARRIGSAERIAEVRDRVGVAWATDAVGAAEQALAMSLDYAKTRVQFGKPIGSFQAVQHICALMLQSLEVARAAAYYALWALDSAPEEAHRAATMARAYAADSLPRVGADAIQVFGGIGFTWEHDAHLYFKRLLSLQHMGASTNELFEELARITLD